MVEQVKERSSFGELTRLRRQFGKGAAGKLAFRTIVGGASCEAMLDEQGILCGEPADRTVDFDALGTYDLVPSCGAHEKLIGTRIITVLERQGRTTVLGRNGWGRA